MVRIVVVLALAAASCAAPVETDARHEKPVAPVTARLEARGGKVTLIATPTADVAGLTLTLDGQRAVFGATSVGVPRTLVARVALRQGEGRDVVGVAEAAGRTTAVMLHVGAPAIAAVAPAVHVVTLPGLGGVAEVRP